MGLPLVVRCCRRKGLLEYGFLGSFPDERKEIIAVTGDLRATVESSIPCLFGEVIGDVLGWKLNIYITVGED